MNGIEQYDERYMHMINNIIKEEPFLKGFFAYLSSNSSMSTIYNYVRYIKNFKNYTRKDDSELDIDDFTLYLTTLKSKSSTYQINVYHALKTYGEYLVAKQILNNNPVDMIKRPKYKESQQTIVKRKNAFLTEDNIKCIINNITKNNKKSSMSAWEKRDLAIVYIFLNTGIRCSALYKLDISSVDLDRKVIIVTDKGNLSREITISDKTANVIQDWLEVRWYIMLGNSDPALFVSNRLNRMSNKAISDILKKYSIGIDKSISPHKLRATFAKMLYENSHDIRFVQKQMGHNSSDTTDIYIRGLEEDDNQRKDKIMNNIIAGL